MATIMYFPEELLELQKEAARPDHYALHSFMNQLPPYADLGDKLGEIAAYCGVQCDGFYRGEELKGLCKVLLNKLRESRGAIEVVSSLKSIH